MGLTEKQKKNLPVALQKAILRKQKEVKVKKGKTGGQLHGDDLKAKYQTKKVPKAGFGGTLLKGIKTYEKTVKDEYKKNPPPKLKVVK